MEGSKASIVFRPEAAQKKPAPLKAQAFSFFAA
jgi:hypothetical protein